MDSKFDKVEEGKRELPDLVSAFQRVSLLVDQTWWTKEDYKDNYKLKSLALQNEVIQSNEMLSNLGSTLEKPARKDDSKNLSPISGNGLMNEKLPPGYHLQMKKDQVLFPTCRMEAAREQKALAIMDPTVPAPLPQRVYTNRCVLAASWPLALLKTYPAITDTLNDPSSRSVFSQKHAVGGIQRDENMLPYSINSVDEFLLHKKISSPAVKNIWAKDPEKLTFNDSKELRGRAWGPELNANVPEFYPSVLLPPRQCPPRYSNIFGVDYQSEVFPYNEDKTMENNEAETVKQSIRGASDRTTLKSPELRPNKTRADLTYWLQNVYPQRVTDLTKLGAVGCHFERVSQHVGIPFPVTQNLSGPAPSPFPPSSERRLYRDVLARKAEDATNKREDADQNPFDELERQALEQYQSSETCLVGQGSDPVDSKFQDLEREALEQYTEDGDDQVGAPAAQPSTSQGFSCHVELNIHQTNQCSKFDVPDTSVPKSIVSSASTKMSSPQEAEVFSFNEMDPFPATISHSKSKKHAKKKKERQMAEEQKFGSGKQREKLRSGSSTSFQLLHAASSEEEVRRLATNLKSKVLNYLRGVDLRIAEDSRKATTKNKDSFENPIQRRVRVSDIVDLETYKTYIREISAKTRSTLLLYFKRIRSEIMESSSRGMVSFVSPTTCEKRNVKKIIKKCLELKNHAETMVDIPRNLLNGIKREVLDTLELVHHTMEVIYTLSNMSKEAAEDVEYLKGGGGLVAELYLGKTTLEDKSPYIKQRVLVKERSVLLVVLFPRMSGLLYDRHYQTLAACVGWSIYIDHDDLRYEHELSLRELLRPDRDLSIHMGTSVRVNNRPWFPDSKTEPNEMWSPKNWTHVLQAGDRQSPARVTFGSTCRQAEKFVWATLGLYRMVRANERKQCRQSPRVNRRREPAGVNRAPQWENVPSRKKPPRR